MNPLQPIITGLALAVAFSVLAIIIHAQKSTRCGPFLGEDGHRYVRFECR